MGLRLDHRQLRGLRGDAEVEPRGHRRHLEVRVRAEQHLRDDLLHPGGAGLLVGRDDDVVGAKPEIVPDRRIEVMIVQLSGLARSNDAFGHGPVTDGLRLTGATSVFSRDSRQVAGPTLTHLAVRCGTCGGSKDGSSPRVGAAPRHRSERCFGATFGVGGKRRFRHGKRGLRGPHLRRAEDARRNYAERMGESRRVAPESLIDTKRIGGPSRLC